MNTEQIALTNLKPSAMNARRTPTKLDPGLKANIAANGLLHNLVVVSGENGTYEVVDGGRRLNALLELQAEGNLLKTHKVACQVFPRTDARELSLSANVMRLSMHPADEFEAFKLVLDTNTPEQIAQRFGVTEKHVMQRLQLGKVAPELIAKYRAGEFKLEVLEAFTLTDDQKQQMAVYKANKNHLYASYIKSALTKKMQPNDTKFAKFVGVEAYEAAGGKGRANLFGDDYYFENKVLLEKLAVKKLEQAHKDLIGEGWSWVEIGEDSNSQYSYYSKQLEPKAYVPTKEEKAKLDELKAADMAALKARNAADDDSPAWELLDEEFDRATAAYEAFKEELNDRATFDANGMKSAGAYAYIDYHGHLVISRGIIKAKDAKKLDKAAGKTAPKQKPAGISDSLKRDLERYRMEAMRSIVAGNPHLAFDLLVYRAAMDTFSRSSAYGGIGVSFSGFSNAEIGAKEAQASRTALKKLKDALNLDFYKEKKGSESFLVLQALPQKDKLAILAYAVGHTVPSQLAGDGYFEAALATVGESIAHYWRPTKENYFSRIKKDDLLAIGARLINKAWADERRNWKAGQVIDAVSRLFLEPEKQGVEAELRINAWLPDNMAIKPLVIAEAVKTKKKAA